MPPNFMLLTSVPHDPDAISAALLQHQYFPNVKARGEELPPFFSSMSFTPDLATKLANLPPYKAVSPIIFRTRRFDGLVRRLGLPHPVPYARLVNHLTQNWQAVLPFLTSEESMIKPTHYGDDGRLIAMDYGSSKQRTLSEIRAAQGHRYVARADISNFFPSLYTHSIDWALRGIEVAKLDRSGKSWQSELDSYTQACHYGETTGIMIGPAISNILSEIVLQRVDDNLRRLGYHFVRYVDDFTAYFDSRDAADEFISQLDRALTSYRLVLNSKKTRVDSLRVGRTDGWINEIHAFLPSGVGALSAIRFLQQCELIAHQNPSASVLVYGVKTLLNKRRCPHLGERSTITSTAKELPLLDELVRVNYFHPHLSCFTTRQLAYVAPLLTAAEKDRIAGLLRVQMLEAARRSETDTVLWMLYAIRNVLRRPIVKRDACRLIAMEDDLVWVALGSTSRRALGWVTDRAKAIDSTRTYATQEHWLSRYELFRIGRLKTTDIDPKTEKSWFQLAKKEGLRFSTIT